MARMRSNQGKEVRAAIRYYLLISLKNITVNRMASSTAGPVPKPGATEDEALAAFESIPLFMKSLPEDDIQNPTLSALQSLIYEGTPDGESDISPIHLL